MRSPRPTEVSGNAANVSLVFVLLSRDYNLMVTSFNAVLAASKSELGVCCSDVFQLQGFGPKDYATV